MVWIHGGGYTFGAASQPLYDGANLARRGAIVVGMNYRLGPLGFLSLPQLSAESGRGASGDYGLMDQIEALRLGAAEHCGLRRRSASRHDLRRVGRRQQRLCPARLSAGAGTFPAGHLTKRGDVDLRPRQPVPFRVPPRRENGTRFRKALQGAGGRRPTGCLAGLNADDLLKATAGFEGPRSLEFRSDRPRFGPVVDGWVIPDDPMTLFDKGQVNAVPLLVGANANEGSLFLFNSPPPKSRAEYDAMLEKSFGAEEARAVSGLYPPDDLRLCGGRPHGRLSVRRTGPLRGRSVSERAHIPVYFYHFAHPTPGAMGELLGAHHGAEIAYALDNLQLAPHREAVDDQIRDALAGYWVQFAATGNPNRPGLPNWPAYDASHRCLLVKDSIGTTQNVRKAKLDLMEKLIDEWRTLMAGNPAASHHDSAGPPANGSKLLPTGAGTNAGR